MIFFKSKMSHPSACRSAAEACTCVELSQLAELAQQYHVAVGYIEHMLYQQLEKVCVGIGECVGRTCGGDYWRDHVLFQRFCFHVIL